MKHFLIPFTIAILIHVLLLRFQGGWVQKRLFQTQPAPIALALTYVKPKTPPLPSLPPSQEVLNKQEPVIPEAKKPPKPEQPKALTPERPPAPKPKILELKPPIREPRKEIARKKTSVPIPRPEPSPQPTLEDERPQPPSAPSPPASQGPGVDPVVPEPSSPRQTQEGPLPPRSDPNPDKGPQLTALTPTKVLKEAVPIYRRNPAPGYPRIARRKGYEGTVVLEVLVGREGKVSDLRVSQSCGHSVLDEAAAASVRSWVFDPGKIDDKPVEMWVRVPVRFQLQE